MRRTHAQRLIKCAPYYTAVERLRFEEALIRGGPYGRALPAALTNASSCRVLESHGDQVRLISFVFDCLMHPCWGGADTAQQQLRLCRPARPAAMY